MNEDKQLFTKWDLEWLMQYMVDHYVEHPSDLSKPDKDYIYNEFIKARR